jgi:XTP/dITP diphosphohydrolase
MHILIATHNAWKEQLFIPIFRAHGFKTLSLVDLPDAGNPPKEDGLTAIENALLKAYHYHSSDHPWVFGDDAGLEIDALDGAPGVQARRWGGVFSEDVDDQTWLDHLLERMKDIPAGKRTAAFVAGWVLVDPDGNSHTHEVRAPFELALQPIRPISPGSPITAVRLGLANDLSGRQDEIRTAWEEWGILEKLLANNRSSDTKKKTVLEKLT